MFKSPLNILRNAFPFVGWISNYSIEDGIGDIIAGVTVGLMLIPQSIAYAGLAGLPAEYGLYSCLCGGFIYALFGTVPELSIAPTALLSLLTLTYSSSVSFGIIPASVLLCFYSGIIEVCCGLLHLGFLVDFISAPAVVGLTSAAAILIVSSQLRNVFGLPYSKNRSFIGVWKNFFQNIHNISLWDTVLSICCCSLLLIFVKLKDYGIPPVPKHNQNKEEKYRKFKIFLWFLSVSRNALVVLISTMVSYNLLDGDQNPFFLSDYVESGLPKIAFPQLEIITYNRTYTFFDMTRELATGIFVLPFIAIVANVAIAKSFTQSKVLDASQEMLAVGLCNVVGAFVGSIPVNASFTRAAVGNASGVKTPLSGIYTAIMVILSLTFLTPFFIYIPKATLGSVIICAVCFMVEVSLSKKIWNLNKIDVLPLFVTFVSCLFLGVEFGILLGVVVDVFLLLFYISRPRIDVQRVIIQGKEYVKIIPLGSVFYPSAEFFRERIMKNEIIIDKYREGNVIIIDCSKLTKTDFTTAKCMGMLADDLQKSNKTVAFLRLSPNLTKLLAKTCRNCIFAFTDDALSEMLKERRYSDILDSYKNIKVEDDATDDQFSVVTSKV